MSAAVSVRGRSVLELAASVSGYPIVVEEGPVLDVWSITKFPRAGERICRIRYQPAHGKYLDYLVAHECGHIYRFFSAQPGNRLLPAMDSKDLKFAKDQVAKEFWKQRQFPSTCETIS